MFRMQAQVGGLAGGKQGLGFLGGRVEPWVLAC